MTTQVDASAIVEFDYSAIDSAKAHNARASAERIRRRMRRSAEDIIEIGRDLLATKQALGHGYFLAWIDSEFSITKDTASRFMNVARRFGDEQISQIAKFQQTVLYELAAPKADPALVDAALREAAAGKTVDRAALQRLKVKSSGPPKTIDLKAEYGLDVIDVTYVDGLDFPLTITLYHSESGRRRVYVAVLDGESD